MPNVRLAWFYSSEHQNNSDLDEKMLARIYTYLDGKGTLKEIFRGSTIKDLGGGLNAGSGFTFFVPTVAMAQPITTEIDDALKVYNSGYAAVLTVLD